jgi:2'-5' RNA ligase
MNKRRLGIVHMLSGQAADTINKLRGKYDPKSARAVGAHVTLAGPFETDAPINEIEETITCSLKEVGQFDLEIKGIDTFLPVSAACYFCIEPREKLASINSLLIAQLGWKDKFSYHPHVTVTEYLSREETEDLFKQLQQLEIRMRDRMDKITLVERNEEGVWIPVAEFSLEKC